ncbi:MAG: pilus assembly protein [Alphaproteobacteria bacterium]|nr:pilus assembly protein [Alphaproteobacteria bacterium]
MFLNVLKLYFKSRSGASAVEFALLAPLLILMLIGTVDFGFFTMERMRLQNTAAAAADYVARAKDDTNVQTVAQESYAGDFSDVTLTSDFVCMCSDGSEQTCPVSCGASDYQRRYVSVNASRTFQPLIMYPGIPRNLDLSMSVRMRVD